jgi:prepilin peptidase CpaA
MTDIISEWMPFVVVGIAATVAAVSDLRGLRISNRLTVSLLVVGIVFHTFAGAGWSLSVAGAAVGFGALILLYAVGGMGAGDVKLMAGIGAWLGPALTLHVLLMAGVALGVTSVILQIRRKVVFRVNPLRDTVVTVADLAKKADRRKHLVPFACMLFLGLAGTLAETMLQLN